jgi:predicted HAD superfamily Cof-like phosphohydrolase
MAEVFQEIQRSNMSKLDKNGKPIFREDGKVLKSDLYFKPNIKKILDA